MDKKERTVTAALKTGGKRGALMIEGVSDYTGRPVEIFDLGGTFTAKVSDLAQGTYEVRVTTLRNVIFTGVLTK